MTDEQKNAIDHAQKILRAVKLYDHAALLSASIADTSSLSDDRIDWLANAHCPNGMAYPSQVKHAIREALREASIADTAGAKPVAWMNAEGWFFTDDPVVVKHHEGLIPLYAAPPAPSVADASGASDKPLTDAQIEAGWRQTFSTENPYCPCNLKSFTKAVRWAERAKESSHD